MANLIKLSFLLAAIVCLVTSEDSMPKPRRGDVVLGGANDILDHSRSKVLIEKPVLLEVNNVETKENPEIQLARPVVDEIANNMAPLTKLEPASKIIGKDEANINNENNNKDALPSSVPLEPIPLIMPQLPFGMPAFMQQIFDSLKSSNPLSMISSNGGEASSQTSEESGTNGDNGVRHGSLTILLMKSLKPSSQLGQVVDDKSLGANEPEQDVDGIKTRKIVLYKFMPRFRLGGKGDPDNDPNFMASNDDTKNSVHLLGKFLFYRKFSLSNMF